MSPRALLLLVTAGFIGYLVLKYPQAATPALVVVGVIAALDRMVGRNQDRE